MFLLHLQWILQPRIVCVLIWISNNNLAAAALLTCKIPKYIIDVHSQSCFHSLKKKTYDLFLIPELSQHAILFLLPKVLSSFASYLV